MFDRVLIANRGEIAVRIARTCKERGVSPVAVFSDVDAGARHVAVADQAVHLPGVAATDTYLNIPALLDAATTTGADAIHPGYGFLAESAAFAAAVADAGLAWIGPPADALEAIGDKISARRIAEFASQHGYPVAIKAAGGGGGRGLKVAHSERDLEAAFESARREAQAYFGSEAVYVERYQDAPKHL